MKHGHFWSYKSSTLFNLLSHFMSPPGPTEISFYYKVLISFLLIEYRSFKCSPLMCLQLFYYFTFIQISNKMYCVPASVVGVALQLSSITTNKWHIVLSESFINIYFLCYFGRQVERYIELKMENNISHCQSVRRRVSK